MAARLRLTAAAPWLFAAVFAAAAWLVSWPGAEACAFYPNAPLSVGLGVGFFCHTSLSHAAANAAMATFAVRGLGLRRAVALFACGYVVGLVSSALSSPAPVAGASAGVMCALAFAACSQRSRFSLLSLLSLLVVLAGSHGPGVAVAAHAGGAASGVAAAAVSWLVHRGRLDVWRRRAASMVAALKGA